MAGAAQNWVSGQVCEDVVVVFIQSCGQYQIALLGRRGNLFANLSRVVIEGSCGLGNRLERQDEGSWTDLFKELGESCSRRSVRLGMGAQYNELMSGMSLV